MLFNSIEFFIFLPIVFLLYWFVFKSLKWKNLFLVISSYAFYAWCDWRFLSLIFFTTVCSYLSGILTKKALDSPKQNSKRYAKIIAATNVLLNLSILGVFKYYNFFVDSFVVLFQRFGIHLDWTSLNIILPVGISFYTFQALSYTIDVYKRKMEVTHDIIAFFVFVSFFPQLLAGPIGRATSLLPQFLKSRSFNYNKSVDGMRQILWGLFKKMVVADNCAIVVNQIWGNYHDENGLVLLIGAMLFTFQIYGDFSGYSDIAIGTARLFGIDLMRNFNFPYFSRDIAEFWRKWHISLTSWFRDYIYIPLGGSRVGKWKGFRNTVIIFLVSGLWHGANWTFVIWGAFHALLFLPLLLAGKNKRYKDEVSSGRSFPSMNDLFHIIVTFLLVTIGWIIFKADNIMQALDYISCILMNLDNKITFNLALITSFFYILILIVVEWIQRDKQHALEIDNQIKSAPLRIGIYYAILAFVIFFSGKEQQFIYFQF